jgi:hypothetical protein
MKKNKIITIPIVLIITLAFCGIAYAHWFDQVHVEGVTKGGTVNLAFDWLEPPQYAEFHMNLAGQLVPGEYLGKDVGYGSAYFTEEDYDVHTLKYGYQKLIIDMFCAYPSYRGHTTFKIHNIGTVPVNICRYIITGERWTKDQPDVPGVKEYDLIFIPTISEYQGEMYEDRNGNGEVDDGDVLVINLDIINGYLPYQLDPCNTNKQEIDVHFKQDAAQCHKYLIFVEIAALQWNKDCADWVYP